MTGPGRNLAFEASIIINDLKSMNIRIEQLQGHPKYTEAQIAVDRAMKCIAEGSSDLHQSEMRERFAKEDRRSG